MLVPLGSVAPELCIGRPLVEENNDVANPPGEIGATLDDPIAAPKPDEVLAVQKTLATICEGVIPTMGTLALG